MIIPQNPRPSYIFVCPKPPKPTTGERLRGHVRRTYGDHLGVIGILSAYGSVFGEHVLPELLNPDAMPDDFMHWEGNFYLIASPKTNCGTHHFLKWMQGNDSEAWRFEPERKHSPGGDYEEQLCGWMNGKPFRTPLREKTNGDPQAVMEDYGLIFRGPHPEHRSYTVTILAGPHSLGTGAACLAATNSPFVRQIAERLGGIEKLADQTKTIWALVKGFADDTLNIDIEKITIVDAGSCV